MTEHFTDFPFQEYRKPSGDYFTSCAEAEAAGYPKTNIWSVVECDGSYSYGPPHHYVNVIGFIGTAESHDGDTYYHEEDPEDGHRI